MSLLSGVPLGVQTPRVRLVPRAAKNDVDDAVFLASSYGLTPDEWQENVLEGWLGIRQDGKWASPRCGLAVPRQNGKNGAIEIRELHGMVTLGERFLHTAHEVKTARKAFTRLLSFFENERQYPELAGLVREIRKTNGQEAIVLKNGGSVEFIARSKGSGRGFSVDVLIMDEAQELSEDSLAALLPTISASPNPQQIMTGTPPGPTANGEVFTRLRNAGNEAKDRRLCWLEWGCEGAVDLDDRGAWAAANPALGIRLSYDTTTDERAAMDDDTFARERLGMWAVANSHAVIDGRTWAKLADQSSVIVGPISVGVDVSPNRDMASVAVAGFRADGRRHVEVTENRRGADWLQGYLLALHDAQDLRLVVIDEASQASAMLPFLREAGVNIEPSSGRDMGRACATFYNEAMNDRLRHIDAPVLNSALGGARKRDIGTEGLWGWSRKNSQTDITPLVAVTLAIHGCQFEPPEQVDNRMFCFN